MNNVVAVFIISGHGGGRDTGGSDGGRDEDGTGHCNGGGDHAGRRNARCPSFMSVVFPLLLLTLAD